MEIIKLHLFVNVIMFLQFCAVLSYTYQGKYALATYWLSCCTINFLVTYMLPR
jgi:hypothetical protein